MIELSEKPNTAPLRRIVEKLQIWGVPLFVFACITRAVLLAHQIPLGDSWMDGVVLAIGIISTLHALSKWLPAQNWISIAVLIILLSGAFEWRLSDGDFILPSWGLPLIWAVALINARGTAQWMLQRWRASWGYGFWIIGLTSGLAAMCVTAISIITGQMENEDSPWMSFALRFAVACLLLVINAMLFIRKNPKPRPPEKEHLTLWLTANLLVIIAAAIQNLWWLGGIMLGVNMLVLSVKNSFPRPPASPSAVDDVSI